MFRILSVVFVGCFLFASESMAMDGESESPYSTPKKRKKEDDKNPKKQKIAIEGDENTSLNNQTIALPDTPTKAEQKFYSPIKRELAINIHRNGEKKAGFDSPKVRRTFARFDKGRHFRGEMTIKGRRILQTNLFNPDDIVLHEGQWVTNLQRMEMGFDTYWSEGSSQRR